MTAWLFAQGTMIFFRADAIRNARPANAEEADTVLGVPLSEHFLKPFTAYTEFCRSVGVTPLTFGNQESYLVGQRTIDEIRFVCLNSGWFAKDDNDKGKLWFGLPHLKYLEANRQLDLVNGKDVVPSRLPSCTILRTGFTSMRLMFGKADLTRLTILPLGVTPF